MKGRTALKISILSLSFLLMIRLTISAALAEMAKAFPEVSQGSLMNMVALASIMSIPFGFLSSILSKYVNKRTLMFTGLVLYLIGGLGPMFVDNFDVILVLRGILGAGIGIIIPLCAGLIGDFFTGDERTTLIGYQSVAVAVGNIVTSILAGILATISWKMAFLIYAFAIIVFILTYFFVPEPETKQEDESKTSTINANVIFVCVAMLLYAVVYISVFSYAAFVIDGNNLGNAASVGFGFMLMTIASMVSALLYGKLKKLLKRFTVFTSIILNLVGFALFASASSIEVIYLSLIAIGLGFGYAMPAGVDSAISSVHRSAATFTNGLVMTAVNLGASISPAVLLGVGSIFNNQDGQFAFMVCAVALAVGAVISLGLAFARPNQAAFEVSVNEA